MEKMAAVLDEVGKSVEKLQNDVQNEDLIEDLETENGAEEASKKKKRKKKKKKAGKNFIFDNFFYKPDTSYFKISYYEISSPVTVS